MLQELAARPHNKRIVHLDSIRSVGVIVHNLSQEENVTLSQFTNVMTSRGAIVRKIELPAESESLLDKLGLPKADFTRLFTTYQYDILIDATPCGDIFGLYITLVTASSLRIGYIDTTIDADRLLTDAYDLIIRGQGPGTLMGYLTEILNCLTRIRK